MTDHAQAAPSVTVVPPILRTASMIAGPVLLAPACYDLSVVWPTVTATVSSLLHTAPFFLFAVSAVACLKASGAKTLLVKAFVDRQGRMIVLAALLGGQEAVCGQRGLAVLARGPAR